MLLAHNTLPPIHDLFKLVHTLAIYSDRFGFFNLAGRQVWRLIIHVPAEHVFVSILKCGLGEFSVFSDKILRKEGVSMH